MSGRLAWMSRPPLVPALALALGLAAVTAVGGELKPGPDLTEAGFAVLADALGDALAFPLLTSSAPLGVLGFEASVSSGGPTASGSSDWWRHGVEGSPTLGLMPASRLVVRKGLPARVDVGVQAGQVLGQSFWGVEGRWALSAGGIMLPAVSLRASHARLAGAPLDTEVTEAGLAVSKGLANITPYAAAAYRWTRADGRWGLDDEIVGMHRKDRVVMTVGVRVSLGPVFLAAEGFQGSRRGVLAGVGVRL